MMQTRFFSILGYLNMLLRGMNLILVLLLFLANVAYSQVCQEPVEFADANLEKAINKTLGKLLDQPITCEELVNLQRCMQMGVQ